MREEKEGKMLRWRVPSTITKERMSDIDVPGGQRDQGAQLLAHCRKARSGG